MHGTKYLKIACLLRVFTFETIPKTKFQFVSKNIYRYSCVHVNINYISKEDGANMQFCWLNNDIIIIIFRKYTASKWH